MKKLLFTGGGGAGNEAISRLLSDRYEIHFADADVHAIDPVIPADRRHAIPFASDPGFADRLCELAEKLEVDLLVPGVDEELPLVADLVDAGRISALLPPAAFVRRNLDKFTSMQFLEKLGLAPRTVLAEEAEAIGFPCIVKPRQGRGSRGVSVIRSAEKLAAYLTLSEGAEGSCIAQELGQGEEFTVMMAADSEGALRAIVPVAVGIKRGITLRAKTCRDDVVEEACSKVHAADPVPGSYNVQLIRQEDGRVLVFEINPRVSTTLCLGVAAGVNPIELFLQEPTGAGPTLRPFTENLQLHRFWVNRLTTDCA